MVVDNVLKNGEKKEVTERENEKVSGSVRRLWSLGLVQLQSHCRSHLAPIGSAVEYLQSKVQPLSPPRLCPQTLRPSDRPGRVRPPRLEQLGFSPARGE